MAFARRSGEARKLGYSWPLPAFRKGENVALKERTLVSKVDVGAGKNGPRHQEVLLHIFFHRIRLGMLQPSGGVQHFRSYMHVWHDLLKDA